MKQFIRGGQGMNIKRILTVIFSTIGIVVLIVGAVGVSLPRRSFPQISGELTMPELDAPVEIVRDGFGIPHIYAQTSHDLFFAQGFVHAQDRFWQMDFWRHIGSGRLAELFGESQLETDIFLRKLGWARVATQELDLLDPVSRAILDDYSQGVNAYLSGHQGSALSLEYAVLKLQNPDYQPEPWTPLHTLTWAKVMAWDLSGKFEESDNANLLAALSSEQYAQLTPSYPEDHPLILPSFQLTASASPNLASLPGAAHPAGLPPSYLQALTGELHRSLAQIDPILMKSSAGIGSNNWVLSGKLTSTGMPLLANDPHLGIQMPSIWYEVDLQCTPKSEACPYRVTGFSFAGVPGVIIGHNDRIAWGFTNVGPDVLDLYMEKLNPQDANQYEVNGKWMDMTVVEEVIQVAGGKPVTLTVRSTRHGPVIWESHDFADTRWAGLPENPAVAVRWTALDPSQTFAAIWRMNRAQNWEEFRQAARSFDVPSQNFIYADVEGNIGYQMPGKIPIRQSGDGSLPAPGWTDAHEWIGYIPFEELPFAYNPPEGYIATANNAVVGLDYPYMISNSWDYGYRAARIVQMIETAPGPIDLAYLQRMQGDNANLMAEILAPLAVEVAANEPELADAAALLQTWDYQDHMDDPAAGLFNAFWKHLLSFTFNDDLNEESWPAGGSRWFEVMRALVKQPDSPWWDDRSTEVVEDRDQVLLKALRTAIEEMQRDQGKDASQWSWGDQHVATFRNQSFGLSGIAPIEALFNRGPYRASGGSSIVNATGWDARTSYEVEGLPSMRMIVDLSNLENSLAVHTTGQSGHAYHPHYIDMADLWRKIEYHAMSFERKNVIYNAEGILILKP
jgi:penicillin amidase